MGSRRALQRTSTVEPTIGGAKDNKITSQPVLIVVAERQMPVRVDRHKTLGRGISFDSAVRFRLYWD